MQARRFLIEIWPHTTFSTVTVRIEDTSGRRRVSGGIGKITLPVGIADFTGEPVGVVLTYLGEALIALGSPHPPEGGPAPLEGPRGGVPGQEELTLDLT